jgi:glutamate synthase domain-containing protein 3
MADRRNSVVKIDASGVYYRELNTRLREAALNGVRKIELHNIHGQRYIGTDLDGPVELEIFGTPGNDLGAFMNGPRIIVHGNAQDGCGNTMNEGEIIVHGHAGDIIGLSARGGRIFVREDVGYRAGIHMKEYQGKKPVLVIGGTAQDFLGEYMAGGILRIINWARRSVLPNWKRTTIGFFTNSLASSLPTSAMRPRPY